MEELLQTISNFGVSLVIVALFLYDWFTTRKNMQKSLEQNSACLSEIQNTNKNTAKSLELLQKSMDNQSDFLKVHDKRCEKIQNNLESIEMEVKK